MRYLRLMLAAVLGTAVLFSGTSVQAAPLFDFSSETGKFTPSEITLGYTFEVTSGSISVDGIGLFDFSPDGLDSAHQVALWDINGNLVIAPLILNPGSPPSNSEMSNSGLGSYIYVDIAPRMLGPGEYVLGVSYLPSGGNTDVAVSMPVDIKADPSLGNVDYGAGRFGAFGDPDGINVVFPDIPGFGNNYFGPALRISATVPELHTTGAHPHCPRLPPTSRSLPRTPLALPESGSVRAGSRPQQDPGSPNRPCRRSPVCRRRSDQERVGGRECPDG